jgi:hypothetical protein
MFLLIFTTVSHLDKQAVVNQGQLRHKVAQLVDERRQASIRLASRAEAEGGGAAGGGAQSAEHADAKQRVAALSTQIEAMQHELTGGSALESAADKLESLSSMPLAKKLLHVAFESLVGAKGKTLEQAAALERLESDREAQSEANGQLSLEMFRRASYPLAVSPAWQDPLW